MTVKKIFIITIFSLLTLTSVSSQNLETRIDKFYADFLKKLKEVKAEKNDDKAISLMKKMREDLLPTAMLLNKQLESYINKLSEEKLVEWEDKMKDKFYSKEIYDLTYDFAFIDRVYKNSDFELGYYELIDLSDKVLEIHFAEPVDPQSHCEFTLNGGSYKNQVFQMVPARMKEAAAYSEEGNLIFNIEGSSKENQIGLSFLIHGEIPATYNWQEDYNFTLTVSDGKEEVVLGGHSGEGQIIIDYSEPTGGWIAGSFKGSLEAEGKSKSKIEVLGSFKVRRIVSMH